MRIWLVACLALLVGGIIGWGIGNRQLSQPVLPAQTGSVKQMQFRQSMRKLWEDHITWTRLWIVDFATNNGFATADAVRLMQNQEDIGTAIKPFCGEAAGNQLTTLLKAHITGAVSLVTAARNKDAISLEKANTAWYDNANQIADFLSKANPQWMDADLRFMMRSHLDFTKQEALDVLGKKYDASVSDYDNVHAEILQMADTLSDGIIKQFPDKF